MDSDDKEVAAIFDKTRTTVEEDRRRQETQALLRRYVLRREFERASQSDSDEVFRSDYRRCSATSREEVPLIRELADIHASPPGHLGVQQMGLGMEPRSITALPGGGKAESAMTPHRKTARIPETNINVILGLGGSNRAGGHASSQPPPATHITPTSRQPCSSEYRQWQLCQQFCWFLRVGFLLSLLKIKRSVDFIQ